MEKRCSLCAHKDSARINMEIVDGASYRDVAQRWNLEIRAVAAHVGTHMAENALAARDEAERLAAESLLAEVRNLQLHTLRGLDAAERSGDMRAQASFIREARANYELLRDCTERVQALKPAAAEPGLAKLDLNRLTTEELLQLRDLTKKAKPRGPAGPLDSTDACRLS